MLYCTINNNWGISPFVNIIYWLKYTFLFKKSFLGHISKDTEALILNDRCAAANIRPKKTG